MTSHFGNDETCDYTINDYDNHYAVDYLRFICTRFTVHDTVEDARLHLTALLSQHVAGLCFSIAKFNHTNILHSILDISNATENIFKIQTNCKINDSRSLRPITCFFRGGSPNSNTRRCIHDYK